MLNWDLGHILEKKMKEDDKAGWHMLVIKVITIQYFGTTTTITPRRKR